MTNSINNLADVIDSRDVIARIEELRDERDSLAGFADDFEADGDPIAAQHAREDLAKWNESDDAAELAALEALADEAADYAPDWEHGETLVRDSYFEEYAQELAEDIGAINLTATWPNNCIDWERAARELQMDYTSVTFDGVTYWIR